MEKEKENSHELIEASENHAPEALFETEPVDERQDLADQRPITDMADLAEEIEKLEKFTAMTEAEIAELVDEEEEEELLLDTEPLEIETDSLLEAVRQEEARAAAELEADAERLKERAESLENEPEAAILAAESGFEIENAQKLEEESVTEVDATQNTSDEAPSIAETVAQAKAEAAAERKRLPETKEAMLSAVESILFAAETPITPSRLREVFGEESPNEVTLAEHLESLRLRYLSSDYGMELREIGGGYQFTTKVQNAHWVQRFLQTKPFRVGRSALEVLAIIAYRQPVTRAEIDSVRGIDSSHLLRVLIERGLVKMGGKAEIPGRPVQYQTTPKFLETVGLVTVAQLPPISELDQLQGHTEDPLKKLEEGLNRIIDNTKSAAEVDTLAPNTDGLAEIEALISTSGDSERELYESPVHAEVASENEAALIGFQQSKKPIRRRKSASVRYEELTTTTLDVPVPPPSNDEPKLVN